MKILHIIPTLHGGGAEMFCINLCNHLCLEHDVTICSLFTITENMFMVKALNSKIKIISLNKKLGLDLTIFYKIYKLIKNGKYDIVNTHLRALSYCDLATICTKSKFFYTVHSMAAKETSKINRLHYSILFRYLGVTPIGISHEVSRSIQSEYGYKFDILIKNGIQLPKKTNYFSDAHDEISSYKKTPNTKVFLTIGRIVAAKNYTMLVEVFNRFIEEGEDITLLIIGDDPQPNKQLLNELIKRANEHIHFLGLKENIADYLLCSDAFCLSSLYEGLPITLLESMSLGIIPICTPAGGIVDVLHDHINGFLSSNLFADSYYVKIQEFLSMSIDKKLILSKNAINEFNNSYDISITGSKYIKLYTRCITKEFT